MKLKMFVVGVLSVLVMASCEELETNEKIKKGINHLMEKEYFDALDEFEEVIENEPNNYYAWVYKGITYTEMGYKTVNGDLVISNKFLNEFNIHDKALDCYDKAIEINPELYYAWSYKGNTLFAINRFREAIDCYNESIALNPNNKFTWIAKFYAYEDLKMWDKALKCSEKVSELSDSNSIIDLRFLRHYVGINKKFKLQDSLNSNKSNDN